MEQDSLRGFHVPQPAKVTVESDVVVPVLQATAIGVVVGLAGGAGSLLFGPLVFDLHGAELWAWTGRVAGGSLVVAVATSTMRFIAQHRRLVVEPLDLLWERLIRSTPSNPPQETQWRVVRPYSKRPTLTATVDKTVESIEPSCDPEIKKLYEFIVRVWPTGNCGRAACAKLGFGRSEWERMIGGRRGKRGQESGRGLLDRAGLVEKTSVGWSIVGDLEAALSWNSELRQYADAKATLVQLS